MSNFIVGLTGGIGSGKTTVANLFAKYGIELIDADVVAREVVSLGTEGLKQIAHYFGQDVLLPNGELNRAHLRELIFADPAKRAWLNNLLHPIIRSEMLSQAQNSTSPYCIMVVPLLFENGLDSLVDRTLMVDISPQLQQSRTMARDGVSAQQVENIIASQASREEKRAKADDIVDNQGLLSALESQVSSLHSHYLKLVSEHKNNN